MYLEIFSFSGPYRNWQTQISNVTALPCRALSPQSYRCPIAMSHTWRAGSFQMHMQTSRINLPYWNRESFSLQRKENKLQPSEHYHANWFQPRLTAVVFYHIQVQSHVCKRDCTSLEVFDLTQWARTGSACAETSTLWNSMEHMSMF